MNKKVLFVLPFVAVALAGCATNKTSSSTSAETYQMKWITPTGTPTIAFYDQGANTNWETTSTPGKKIPAAFGAGAKDAIVFDGVNGLSAIKANNFNYKLAKWISEGNFYVVSTQHKAGEAFVTGQTIEGFVQKGNAGRAFSKLSVDKWGWNYAATDVTWLTGVAEVGQILSQSPKSFDYYIVAEPTLSMAKAALEKQGITLNIVYDLQKEWASAYGGYIPAAALFVNATTYADHPEAITSFVEAMQTRLDTAISSPEKVKTALAAYGNDAGCLERFGYTGTTAYTLQYNNANKFGLLKTGTVTSLSGFVSDFQSALGGAAFDSSLFLS